jgi:hypothetical protein
MHEDLSERFRGIPRKLVEEGVKLPEERTRVRKHETRLGKSFWAAFPKKTQRVPAAEDEIHRLHI